MEILVLLFFKHWIVDFVWQTESELKYKGVFGDWRGLIHSLKHGAFTASVVFLVLPLPMSIAFGMLDMTVHYFVDWAKVNYGCSNMKDHKFWRDFGLDQLVHALTYIFMFDLLLKNY